MSDFNPLSFFKNLHQDKLLLGAGSGYVHIKCWAFTYSKQNLHQYRAPIARSVSITGKVAPAPDDMELYGTYDLEKICGPDDDGFYLYAKIEPPEPGY